MARLGEFFSHGFLMSLRAPNIRTTNTEVVQKFNKVKLSITVCHACIVPKMVPRHFWFLSACWNFWPKMKMYSLSRPLHFLLWNLPLLAKDPYAHHTLTAHPDTEWFLQVLSWGAVAVNRNTVTLLFRNRQRSELPTLPTFLCQRSWGCLGHLPILGSQRCGIVSS